MLIYKILAIYLILSFKKHKDGHTLIEIQPVQQQPAEYLINVWPSLLDRSQSFDFCQKGMFERFPWSAAAAGEIRLCG